jgi:hypothetical protein
MPLARLTKPNDILPLVGVPSDLVVAINWNSGLGSGTTAVLDADKDRPFRLMGGSIDSRVEVRSSVTDGKGWAPPTYLRLAPNTGEEFFLIGFNQAVENYIPAWSVGDGALIRYYTKVSYSYMAQDAETHGTEWTEAFPSTNHVPTYMYLFQSGVTDRWEPRVSLFKNEEDASWAGYGPDTGSGGPLALLHANEYRLQMGIKRVASDTMQQFYQIYEGAPGGALLYDHSDFTRRRFSGDGSAGINLTNNTPSSLHADLWTTNLRSWWLGTEGNSLTPNGSTMYEWAGVALRFGPDIDFDASWEFNNAELTWSP